MPIGWGDVAAAAASSGDDGGAEAGWAGVASASEVDSNPGDVGCVLPASDDDDDADSDDGQLIVAEDGAAQVGNDDDDNDNDELIGGEAGGQRMPRAANGQKYLRPAWSLLAEAKQLWSQRLRQPLPMVAALLPPGAEGEGLPLALPAGDPGEASGQPVGAAGGAAVVAAPCDGVEVVPVADGRARWLQLDCAYRAKLCEAMEAASMVVRASPDALRERMQSDDKQRISAYYLFHKTRQMGTMAEAELLKSNHRSTLDMVQATACAATLLFRNDAARFCEALHSELTASGAVALTFSEHVRYDETPMRSRMKDPERANPSASGGTLACAGAGSTHATIECTSTHVVKVLQTERRASLLYRLSDGSFFVVKFWLPCWLQSLSDGKAETYFRSLQASRFDVSDELLASFRRRQRVVCTDGDAAVMKCERCVSAGQASVDTLHTRCEIHKIYGMHKVVFDQMKAVISKLKHIALSLNASDGMRSFRVVLRRVVAERLDYRDNSVPSQHNFMQNKRILDLFLPPSNATSRLRRAIVLVLANGDWLDRRSLVHHCVGRQCCADKVACRAKFTTFLVNALAGASPPVWPQARWLGAEAAIGWIGLLQAVHGLLGVAYCAWAGVSASVPADMNAVRMMAPMLDDCADNDGLGAPAEEGDGEGRAGDGREDDPRQAGNDMDPGAAGADFDQKRKEQARFKASAGRWLASHHHDALGVFEIIATVVMPLAALMFSLLESAGQAGFAKVMSQYCSSVADPGEAGDAGQLRLNHGLLAFRNVFEQACLDDVVSLMREPARWTILPLDCRIGAFQARACLMIASLGCQLHQHMVAHKSYPWKLFGLLGDPSIEQQILQDCELLRDEWSAALIKHYTADGAGGLTSPACLAEIALIEAQVRRETAQIESKHAAIRRSLVGMPVQAHCWAFSGLVFPRSGGEAENLSLRPPYV